MTSVINSQLESLRIPERFKAKGRETSEILRWKQAAQQALKSLKSTLSDGIKLDSGEKARVVSSVAALDGDNDFLDSETRKAAQDVLSSLGASNREVVSLVLEKHIKPRFLSSPHPNLNLSSGRKLPRIAGGDTASQDYYTEQTWKDFPGTANIVSWCLRTISSDDYERIWPLLIPPVMTFLDDYQAQYKLQGLSLALQMTESVPASLLKRTGVGELMLSSLQRALQMLHDDLTPKLIRSTIPVILRLLDMITNPGSAERFNHLCQVLGENIIGGVWIYASNELETIEASMDVLPSLILALGIGTVRYLKALIPQCLHCVLPREFATTPLSLQISSSRALLVIIQECSPRIHGYKGAVIEGVCKCWVTHFDNNSNEDEIKQVSKEILMALSVPCPTVLTEEYPRILQAEPIAFKPIIPVR